MSLVRNFATVGVATMASRLLGFVRDMLLAAMLGTGIVNEAYVAAFRLPNLFRRLLAEGAFNSAFIPLFTRALEEDGPEGARDFARNVLGGLLTVLLVLTAVIEVGMAYAMWAQVPGFTADQEKFDLAVLLGRIMFPYIAFMSVLAMLGGILNSLGRFAAAAFAPVMLNVVLILALMLIGLLGLANTRTAGIILAVGVFIGGIAQLLLVIIDLYRADYVFSPVWPRWNAHMKKLVALMIPGMISGGVTQLNIFIGTIIASWQASAVSYLYFADRLYQLPLGIVGIAIGVVLLPGITRHLRAGREEAAMNSQNRSLEFAMVLTLPAAVALLVIPDLIIQVIFQHGQFTAEATRQTAAALQAFAAGLPAFVLVKVLSPGFFAREDTKTPMYFAMVSVAVNIVGSLILFPFFGHVGIAIATSAAGWVNTALLAYFLRRDDHLELDGQVRRRIPRIVLASIIMGAMIYGGLALLASWSSDQAPLIAQITALIVICIGGALAFFAAAHILGGIRLSEFRAAFRRQ